MKRHVLARVRVRVNNDSVRGGYILAVCTPSQESKATDSVPRSLDVVEQELPYVKKPSRGIAACLSVV